jgi:isovaleryl-CoA dehydrogenase
MRGNAAITLNLEDARVSRKNLLGEEGDQIWYVFEIIAPYFLAAMAGTYLGIAQAALDYTIGHVKTRSYEMSGTTVAHADVVQHRIGELWSRVEAARQLLYSAAYAGDSGNPAALLSVLSSKAEVSDVAVHVVNEAMTLCGGIAYRENAYLARLLRDVRASHVMAPTTDLLRLWTGRALLGQPLL